METLLVVMSMLAVWRAIHILQEENGPWAIFARLQAWVASLNDKPGSFSEGFFCFYCMSMWLSWIPALILQHTNIFLFGIYWLAISSGAIFINMFHSRMEQ